MDLENFENCIIPILFNKTNKLFTKLYDDLLKPYGLSKFHGFYLICLHKNPEGLKLNDFNQIIGCDKANTSRAMSDLESKGFIVRDSDSIIEKTSFHIKGVELNSKTAHGKMKVQGHVRGYVSGMIDADIQGTLKGEFNAFVSTGGDVTEIGGMVNEEEE